MGWSCTNKLLAKNTNIDDLKEVITASGFQLSNESSDDFGAEFYYYDLNDDKNISPIHVVLRLDGKFILVEFDTRIWCSKHDIDRINNTMLKINRFFKGSFSSDFGKGKILETGKSDKPIEQYAFDKAYESLHLNIGKIKISSSLLKHDEQKAYRITGNNAIDQLNPRVILSNMVLSFLVSSMEDFFRRAYIAVLKYSKNKEKILSNHRLQGEEVLLLSKGEITVEAAVAKWMNFQDIDKVSAAFKSLNERIDIFGLLSRRDSFIINHKTKSTERASSYEDFKFIVSMRHEITHRAITYSNFDVNWLDLIINDIEIIFKEIMIHFHEIHGWEIIDNSVL